MFKNFVIGVLAVLLCAGAASSRPSEESFKTWYGQRAKLLAAVEHKNLLQKIFHGHDAESDLDKCVYRDRILWADVEKNGKVQFSGAFGRWVAYDDLNAAIKAKRDHG